MKYVNDSIKKIDSDALLSGKGVYTDDLAPRDALWIKVVRSPHAFAKIRKIDDRLALRVAGVEMVLTHKDLARIPFTRAGQCYPELSPYDKFILDEYVRHVGDDVAIIVAENEKSAEAGAKRLKIDYEVLDPVLDYTQAEGHTTLVHPEEENFIPVDFIGYQREKNLACDIGFEVGNIKEALKNAEVVFRKSYESQAQAQAMMETQRAFSYQDEYGRLVVVSSTQIPFHVRRTLARALDMPMSKIRVIKPRIGGGFGSKQSIHAEFYPALVTKLTGRPSKIVYSRKDVFTGTTSRHKMRFDITLGATKEGKLVAMAMDALSDTGAYGEHANTTVGAAGKKVLTLYNKVEACSFKGKAVYTNNLPGGALRGFGVTQGTFALESAINELAEKLGMDPVKLREMNMIKKGETTPIYNIITKGSGPEPIYMDSCELEACVEKGKLLFQWEKRKDRILKEKALLLKNRKARGVGMAIAQQGSGLPNIDMAGATIKLNDDGFFTLLVGATDIGTGSDTILCQIAAETLDIPVDKINIHASDTDISPFDSGAYASSTTYTSGNAVIEACKNMKTLIREYGARVLEDDMAEISFENGKITSQSGKEITLETFSKKITYSMIHQQLTATGSFVPKKAAPPYMAGFAEVEVDVDTGKVDLLDFVGVVDCGTAINPILAQVQAEGGIVQGIGMALYEEVKVNAQGKLQSNSFMEYKIPTRKDISNIQVELVEGRDDTGPYGAKSIGEVVINTVPPAVMEAIYQAVGARIRTLPATPEKVWKAMNTKE